MRSSFEFDFCQVLLKHPSRGPRHAIYFSRVFKRAKGVPPSKYIASQQAAAPDTPDTP